MAFLNIAFFFTVLLILITVALSVVMTISYIKAQRISKMKVKILQMQIEESIKNLNKY